MLLRANAESPLRQGLIARLASARRQTDSLFATLREQAYFERPIAERHRVIFYLGHLEAFDANLLLRDSLGREPKHPDLDRLFAFGIDAVDGALPSEPASAWPSLDEVRRYARGARAEVDNALADASLEPPAHPNLAHGWAVSLAIEHRLMHAETLCYMIHQLAYSVRKPGPLPPPAPEVEPARLVPIPAGRARLGLSRALAPTIGWDNEYEAHDVAVEAFAIESRDVTNADFMEFVQAGGYQQPSLWSVEDWAWVRASAREHPAFWSRRGGRWYWRAMFGEVPLGPSWPVYVSQAEAAAYARFRERALPTEAEFHRAAYGSPSGSERIYPLGERCAEPAPRGVRVQHLGSRARGQPSCG
jgi:formylglycine-generating enzyme required for sulfatase activity